MENAQDLDMDLLALGLLTPQACCAATPWTATQPLECQQPARSEAASRGKRQPKARQARKRPSAPSKSRKTPQASSKSGRRQFASISTVQITRQASDELTARNALTTDNYAVSDVLNAIEEAFDEVLSDDVAGNGGSRKACFRLRFIRSLLMLRMQHILDANSPHTVVSAEDITERVFELLQRFGISIQ